MAQKPFIAGNWKMNTTYTSAVTLAQTIVNQASSSWEGAQVVLCPPFTALKGVSNVLHFDHAPISLGAQNLSAFEPGAYTGEISAEMLVDLDCSYVIVGHSERRAMGETSQDVAAKARAAQDAQITPIICCGEDLATYEAGQSESFVVEQVKASLAGIDLTQPVVIAYEPIWAIGTGQVATPETAAALATAIRTTLTELGGATYAEQVPILYGGSVKSGNVGLFLAEPQINGVLVGGASLEPSSFVEMVQIALSHV